MEFLDLPAIRDKREPILDAAAELLGPRGLRVARPARQWEFFLHCLNRTMDPAFQSPFDDLPPSRAAQYKFEVEDRLKRYYQSFGRAVPYVFVLVHGSALAARGYMGQPPPTLAGYCVLVREDLRLWPPELEKGWLHAYLERVVSEGVDAEFRAYQALPNIFADELTRWFWEDGMAYRAILNLLNRHRERGWVLNNPLNPSNKRLMSLRIKDLNSGMARIHTTEYWHLFWWNQSTGKYSYSYRETNRQTYLLERRDSDWKILENLRPAPRSSTPNRRVRAR